MSDGTEVVNVPKEKKKYNRKPLEAQVLKLQIPGVPAKITALLSQPGNHLLGKREVSRKVAAIATAAATAAANSALADPSLLSA